MAVENVRECIYFVYFFQWIDCQNIILCGSIHFALVFFFSLLDVGIYTLYNLFWNSVVIVYYCIHFE